MSDAPELATRDFGRWIWRQLTSMRTALLLLLLLAVVAVPGSFFPQRSVDAGKVDMYFTQHPTLAPVLDRVGMFNVYSSVWFSAVYLLLMVSLIGCILPRLVAYVRALRIRPPKAPSNLSRLGAYETFTTEASVDEVLQAGRAELTHHWWRRHRVDVIEDELRAENGYLREFGNLVFHVSIVVVLVGVAITNLWGFRARVVVIEGQGFSNTRAQYDEFSAGALYDIDRLQPFTVTLTDLTAKFRIGGTANGSPELFRATGNVIADGTTSPYSIEVNHPASIDGTDVFLIGQGYAPIVQITKPDGTVVFDDAVVFLPQDPSYTSAGVIKVPDAEPDQLGFEGFFIPTAVEGDSASASRSVMPVPANPLLGLFLWTGDLGLDNGTPQSVYVLDTETMTQVMAEDGDPYKVSLHLGESQTLPDGSTITFTGLKQWARFQVARTPLVWLPLLGVSTGVLGLMLSLYIRPRRTWIRAVATDSGTVVEIAALDRLGRNTITTELERFGQALREGLTTDEGA